MLTVHALILAKHCRKTTFFAAIECSIWVVCSHPAIDFWRYQHNLDQVNTFDEMLD